MILAYDLFLLVGVSALLIQKSLYLGMVLVVTGFLIKFQNLRVRNLIGKTPKAIPALRKVKAAVMSLVIGCALMPIATENITSGNFEKEIDMQGYIPLVVVICLLTSAMMIGLVAERRKR